MTALETILSFPTVLYTVLLGVSALYWAMVIIGAMDMDSVGSVGGKADGVAGALGGKAEGALGALGGKADGALGALGGKAEGALGSIGGKADGAFDAITGKAEAAMGAIGGKADGLADGALEGSAKGAAEGALDVDDGAFSLVNALNLRKAPLTVTLSSFALFGWGASALSMQALAPMLKGASLPLWLAGVPVLVTSAIVSLLITSQVVRPFAKLFVSHPARDRSDLVGGVCVITTGSVDDRFGQAMFDDRAAGLILQVRSRAGVLSRGDKALIIGWDDKVGGFVVEPMKDMLEVVDRDDTAARFEALEEAARDEAKATEEALAEEAAHGEGGDKAAARVPPT